MVCIPKEFSPSVSIVYRSQIEPFRDNSTDDRLEPGADLCLDNALSKSAKGNGSDP